MTNVAGPGIRWALLGPHAILHLAGGPGGIRSFCQHIGVAFDRWWSDMAAWTTLPDGTAEALVVGPLGKVEGRKTRHRKKASTKLIVRGRKRGKATQ